MYSADEELKPRSCGVILPFSAMIAARWILFSSSRTFPGQPCDSMTWRHFGVKTRFFCCFSRLPLKKGFGEQESISFAITQRWYRNAHYIQSIVQVLSESSLRHRLREVNVGCGQNSGVHGNQGAAADPFDLMFLQKAQELHLQGAGQFSYFIEKQCSALGHLDPTLSLHVSTRESSLFVAKQFALQKALRDCAAVDCDKGA